MKKLLVVVTLMLVGTGGGLVKYERLPDCKKANLELAATKLGAVLHAAEMPKSFDEFVPMNLAERRAFFSSLDPTDKYRVMQGQKQFILSHDLTAAQREFVLKAYSYVTVERIAQQEREIRMHLPRTPFMPREFERENLKLFSPQERRDYFTTFGPYPAAQPPSMIQKIAYFGKAAGSGDCGCSVGSSFTCSDGLGPTDGVCRSWGTCTPTSWGCGFGGFYACDGDHCDAPNP